MGRDGVGFRVFQISTRGGRNLKFDFDNRNGLLHLNRNVGSWVGYPNGIFVIFPTSGSAGPKLFGLIFHFFIG